jgi:uncharacterized protein (TIGR02996 family)
VAPAIEAELLAQIAASPADAAPYLVYADWLQQRGDPRGRLIVIQHARAADGLDDDTDEALHAEAEALLADHPELRGPEVALEPPARIDWQYGYWRRVGIGSYSWQPDAGAADAIDTLLAAPSARFLRGLSVWGPLDVAPRFAVARRATLRQLSLLLGREMISDEALVELAECTQLRELELFSCEHVTSDGLAQLRAMAHLERIDLRNCGFDDAGVVALRGLPLRDVAFNAVGSVTATGMRILAEAPLERLSLSGSALADDRLAPLAEHRSLHTLEVARAGIDARGARALASIPALRSLALHNGTLTVAGARELVAARGLRVLDLGHTDQVGDDTLLALGDLGELRALDVASTDITTHALSLLAARACWPQLRALDLSFRPLGALGVRLLERFPNLEQLALGWTDIGDDAVDTLLKLPRLERVDLAAAKLTPAGVARLTAHPTLRTVGLYDCDNAARVRAEAHAPWSVLARDSLDLDLARYAT